MLAWKKDPAEESQFQTQIIVSENSWAARMSVWNEKIAKGKWQSNKGPEET